MKIIWNEKLNKKLETLKKTKFWFKHDFIFVKSNSYIVWADGILVFFFIFEKLTEYM